MKNIEKSPRIVLAGSVGSSRRTLQALLRHRMNVIGVLGLSPEAARSVSGYTRLDDLAGISNIPFVEFRNINEPRVIEVMNTWKPDLLFVVGLSQLVKEPLLSIPRIGCVGFHPTWLPEGRGRAPVAWLILEHRHGAATFFLIDEGVDAGPILVQEPFRVTDQDYAADVVKKLEQAIDRALDRWLPRLRRGEWSPVSQDERFASYYGRRAPRDGLIDWYWSAEYIYTLVRAASRPHPGAYTYVKDQKVLIWRARIEYNLPYKGVPGRILVVDSERGFLVQTGSGLIWLTEVEFQNGDSPFDLLRVGTRLGYVSDDEIFRLKQRLASLESRLDVLERKIGGDYQ